MYRLNTAKLKIKSIKDKLLQRHAEMKLLNKQAEGYEKEIEGIKKELQETDMIQELLKMSSETAKGMVKGRIEQLVSNALQVIYGVQHEFFIDLIDRRGQHECDYYLTAEGVTAKLKKPFDTRGGGKISVIAMAIQLAICEIFKVPGPIFLDEIAKFVDSTAVENVAYFLKEFSQEFNRQIIMVSHKQQLKVAADAVFQVTKRNGISNIKEVVG